MSLLSDLVATVFERRYARAISSDAAGRSVIELAGDLLSTGGEVSGGALARLLLERYAVLAHDDKHAFFRALNDDLGIDSSAVIETLNAYQSDPSKETYRAFADASEPRRQELLRRLNQVSGATAKLVQMRKDLLALIKEDPSLGPVDLDFQHLFRSWFNRGFLVLRPINWTSPAEVLEKIIEFEAVHTIESWDDLRRRVAPMDRRCFAFFHPAMADEPLIFVQVALTSGIPGSIQEVLADNRTPIAADEADTAVFYSITNCQDGLAGISFGNSLIKQVAADLARDHPALGTFVTLSPIPGLCAWLSETGQEPINDDNAQAVAAHYLLAAKRSDGLPVDPVARFHLGNGARVHALHVRADLSENGLRQSGGVMVNYLYDLADVTTNHEEFVTNKTVAATEAVRKLSFSIGSAKKEND